MPPTAETMTGDKILSITLELERLTIILTYKVNQPRLSIPNADSIEGVGVHTSLAGASII
jgi:hypothetical protein